MYDECAIKQGGSVICPVCHNQFDWYYRLGPVSEFGETRYVFETPPSVLGIKPITDPRSKEVRFIMTCKTCFTDIETDSMRLIDEDNYNQHRYI